MKQLKNTQFIPTDNEALEALAMLALFAALSTGFFLGLIVAHLWR